MRSRKEAVPTLTHYFIREFAGALNQQVEEISSEALMYIMNYSCPGDICELENIIEHAVAATSKDILTDDDLPPHIKDVSISEEFKLCERTAQICFSTKGCMSLDEELATHEKCLLWVP